MSERWSRGRFVSQNTDRLDRDEFVMSLSASTTYGAAGLIQPRFVVAFDPRSKAGYNQLSVRYFWSDHVVFNLEQHLYWQLSGNDIGPWSLGDLWGSTDNSRHETVLSVTFQF